MCCPRDGSAGNSHSSTASGTLTLESAHCQKSQMHEKVVAHLQTQLGLPQWMRTGLSTPPGSVPTTPPPGPSRGHLSCLFCCGAQDGKAALICRVRPSGHAQWPHELWPLVCSRESSSWGVAVPAWPRPSPAVPLQLLGLISAVEELPFKQLHGDDGENEHEEHVDDQDVEDIPQRVHHTVKHSLWGRAPAQTGDPSKRRRKGASGSEPQGPRALEGTRPPGLWPSRGSAASSLGTGSCLTSPFSQEGSSWT